VLTTTDTAALSERQETGLEDLPAQVTAWVVRLQPAIDAPDPELLLRLLEIGFLPGERVRVIARGFPAADPLAVRIGHTTFALRRHEAALIRVSTQPGSRVLQGLTS
jgi:ferrous iron transport protein A